MQPIKNIEILHFQVLDIDLFLQFGKKLNRDEIKSLNQLICFI